MLCYVNIFVLNDKTFSDKKWCDKILFCLPDE